MPITTHTVVMAIAFHFSAAVSILRGELASHCYSRCQRCQFFEVNSLHLDICGVRGVRDSIEGHNHVLLQLEGHPTDFGFVDVGMARSSARRLCICEKSCEQLSETVGCALHCTAQAQPHQGHQEVRGARRLLVDKSTWVGGPHHRNEHDESLLHGGGGSKVLRNTPEEETQRQ